MHDFTSLSGARSNGQVWIIDDDQTTLDYFAQVLQNHHIPCRIFDDPRKCPIDGARPAACVLVDWRLGDHDGLQVATEIRRSWPHTSVLLISGNASVPIAVEAMRHELDGVLEKPINEAVLLHEIKAGIERYHARLAAHDEQTDSRRKIDRLTSAELDILKLLVEGLPNKQIALKLSLALRTIEKHRRSMFEKLGVDSAAAATRIWVLANRQ